MIDLTAYLSEVNFHLVAAVDLLGSAGQAAQHSSRGLQRVRHGLARRINQTGTDLAPIMAEVAQLASGARILEALEREARS